MAKQYKQEPRVEALGPISANITHIAKLLALKVGQRGREVSFTGGEEKTITLAHNVWQGLIKLAQKGLNPSPWDVEWLINLYQNNPQTQLDDFLNFSVGSGKSEIIPKTLTQKKYLKSIKENNLVFGLGPAGTGKTYLAVAMAINALNNNEVSRLIFTRPAVEAGENLGFLPGDLEEKINPYLRPLYDALGDLMGYEKYLKLAEKRIIEVAPLAFMRGRTLTGAFIILDEAQNCTAEQLKMFLTRLGPNSKIVVTGDPSQSDLFFNAPSALLEVIKILQNIDDIDFCYFQASDVIRHRLVKKIIEAYEKYEKK